MNIDIAPINATPINVVENVKESIPTIPLTSPRAEPLREENAYINVSNPCLVITDPHHGELTIKLIIPIPINDLIANFSCPFIYASME